MFELYLHYILSSFFVFSFLFFSLPSSLFGSFALLSLVSLFISVFLSGCRTVWSFFCWSVCLFFFVNKVNSFRNVLLAIYGKTKPSRRILNVTVWIRGERSICEGVSDKIEREREVEV